MIYPRGPGNIKISATILPLVQVAIKWFGTDDETNVKQYIAFWFIVISPVLPMAYLIDNKKQKDIFLKQYCFAYPHDRNTHFPSKTSNITGVVSSFILAWCLWYDTIASGLQLHFSLLLNYDIYKTFGNQSLRWYSAWWHFINLMKLTSTHSKEKK